MAQIKNGCLWHILMHKYINRNERFRQRIVSTVITELLDHDKSIVSAKCRTQFRFLGCNPANIYLFKVSNRNFGKRCEICPKLTIKKHQNDAIRIFPYFDRISDSFQIQGNTADVILVFL